ncbi:MAG: type II secretion system protein [Limisphaerales bacterium]
MRTPDRTQPHRGFTLIELLTVLAIIGVLATLLMTALAGAKRKSRQARCTSNLHQIALALNMYLDDMGSRPTDLPVLVDTRYLPAPAALLCPEDKTGNWGGLHNLSGLQAVPLAAGTGGSPSPAGPAASGYSYLHPLSWDDDSWTLLLKKGSSAGIAVCQLHGLAQSGSASADGFPSAIQDFEGLILRAQLDGAVVRRQWFWAQAQTRQADAASPSGLAALGMGNTTTFGPLYPWPLFTDDPPQ